MNRVIQEPAASLSRGTAESGFVNRTLREKDMPAEPSMDRPNRETLEAMAEARRILAHPENYKGMTVDEAFRESGIAS